MTKLDEAARDLAAFLTRQNSYGGKSPLDEIMQARITVLTREIADEVIAATPELRAHVKTQVERVIRDALYTDSYLKSTVTSAVAKAITDMALKREEET